eukprot:TRINITY_DN31199_c0_g1_i2.p1 TRINITY_DN31199_c0_g1~~TRINITY_DN31199_c0_g1_i2.p1  ORF type:complete len:326 (-),score=34.67 TRINITY_DN31199_c0_g1_i2:39-1016(-)
MITRNVRRRRAVSFLTSAALVAFLCGAFGGASTSAVTSTAGSSHGTGGSPDDLLIVGAGYLGRRVAAQWREAYPTARIIGATLTDASHAELRKAGVMEPMTIDALAAEVPLPKFLNIVFCAPPSRSAEEGAYAASIRNAFKHAEEGASTFVFTSSASVYSEDSGGTVDEASPVSDTASARRLLQAEDLVRQAGGVVLRLAGLYDIERGAHAYWLKVGKVASSPDGLINLLHYDDAASAVVAALKSRANNTFLVGDGQPLTRREICESARAAKRFADAPMPTFDSNAAGEAHGGTKLGKRYNTARVQEALKWKPRYVSFRSYMAAL